MNVFDRAKRYIAIRQERDELHAKDELTVAEYKTYSHSLSRHLNLIRNNGYKLMRIRGDWYLASSLDNRKKWRIEA